MDDLWQPFFPGWTISAGMLAVAVMADLLLPEPPSRFHPVVWIGSLAGALTHRFQQASPALAFSYGLLITVFTASLVALVSWSVGYALLAIHPIAFIIVGGLILKPSFAVRGLDRAANETADLLEAENLNDARKSLRNLVSRDASELSQGQVAAAAVESVAENTTDSFLAPWLFFAVAGLPGAFVYRAVNTLDSMIGYRGKFEYLGKSAARLDDVVNIIPARVGVALILIGGLVTRQNVSQGAKTAWSDHRLTSSPNAGWTMATMSGLLSVRLEKHEHYALGGNFGTPTHSDIRAAIRVARLVAVMGLAVALAAIVGMNIAL